MRANSLATRLFLSATAWVVLILLITGIVLSSVYKRSVERAFDRRLNFYLRTLIAEAAQPDDPNDKSDKSDKSADRSVQSLGEPLFELPLSGWYWRMERTDGDKPEVRASRSLWDATLPKLEDMGIELDQSGVRLAYVTGAGRPASAHGGAAGRSRHRRKISRLGGRRRHRNRRRDLGVLTRILQPRLRAERRASAHPRSFRFGSVSRRSSAFRDRWPRSAPAMPSGWRASFRWRSRRWRARPTRCSTPIAPSSSARAPMSEISRMRSRRRCPSSSTRRLPTATIRSRQKFLNRPASCAIRSRIIWSVRASPRACRPSAP